MIFMKRFLVFVLATMTMVLAFAGNITGTVVDGGDKSALAQCTVRLLMARDSAFVKGVASDADGKFSFSGVKNGKYVLQFSFIGYETLNKEVSVTSSAPNVRLGEVEMKENTVMLKETVVLGAKTEIKVMEDTVEYNADAYRTQPNSVVEDLLKRLPGVEVDSDGKITAHGKEVKKILVDGKEFFADDPKVATKNLPTDIVEKLQVVDRKSDLARMTGVDDGEEETVINLTVKKGMNNGWFGNVTAGYGTDDRYGANAIVNRFWNGNQITFIAGANNTNNLGFTDGNSGRFRRFGGDNGINTSQNVGVNFNVGKGEEFRVGGDVMYSHSDRDSRIRLNREYLFNDSSSFYKSNSISRDRGHNLRADFRLKWEIDSFNAIEFRPNFSFNYNHSESADTSMTNAGDALLTPVNISRNLDDDRGKSFEFGGELVYNHKFRQRLGRSFSTQLRYSLSNVREDQSSYTRNTFFITEDEDITNQIIDNHTWSNQVNGRLTWTEPLGDPANARYLVFAYSANYRWNNADKLVYDRPYDAAADVEQSSLGRIMRRQAIAEDLAQVWGPAMTDDPLLARTLVQEGDVFNEDLSNQFRNDFFSQRIQLGFKQVRKEYNLDAGLALNPSMSKSINLINDAKSIPTRWVWNVAPYARFRYKFSKTRNLAFDYRARAQQPSMTQLQPVADKSNPLRVVVGNPNLKPTFTNDINLRFSDFNTEAQRSIMAMIRAEFTANSIISATSYNPETGGQTTTYENVNGVWNLMAMNMISFPFRNKHWQFSNHFFGRYSVTKGYINTDFNRSNTLNLNISPSLAYRNDWLEIQARPHYSFQNTTNTVQNSASTSIHTYGGTADVNVTLPFGVTFASDLSYSARSGYAEGYNTNEWLWNAGLSYQFLRDRSATFSVKAYDLLKQRQNISRSISASAITDQEYNNLTRYVMFSLSFKFNTFGKGSTPQGRDDFRRGPGGGRPPMGGGPGPRF